METITLKDLAGTLAPVLDLPKKQVVDILQKTTQTIVDQVTAGNKVTLHGLGSFEKVQRAARVGVNPSTGEKINIAAKFAPKFKAAKGFKTAVQ